jgi:hypothetical protein
MSPAALAIGVLVAAALGCAFVLARARRAARGRPPMSLTWGPTTLLLLAGVGCVLVLAGAGYGLALLLSGHSRGEAARTTAGTTRVERVTVTGPAHTVTRRLQVVRHIHGRRVIRYVDRTVTIPGKTRVLTRDVVRYRRVVVDKVVTSHGRTTTVKETKTVPDTRTQTRTQTQTQTETRTETVTQPVTATETKTVTAPPATVTVPVTITLTLPTPTTTGP